MRMSEEAAETRRFQATPCAMGCSPWCRKFFWEGQLLDKAEENEEELSLDRLPLLKRVLVRHRRLLAFVIPSLLFHFCYWGIAIKYNIWHLFKEKYFMTITMIFGALVAGMTSEGGSSVAFPVMTLGFQISTSIARDFSLMIQSCGMVCAAASLIFMRVKLEWHSLGFCSLGGVIGVILGLEVVEGVLTSSMKKMGFVSIWFSFAFSLFLLNLYHKRKTYISIPDFGVGKAVILIFTGITGGIFTSFAGSGLDICSFSILTLLFRISEKVATPTSVILMAGNTLVGFYWRGVMMRAISKDAWEFMAVCVPVSVIGAPLGSLIGSHFHRHVLTSLVYISDTVALIIAFIVVKQSNALVGMSVGIIVTGLIFFSVIMKTGEWLMNKIEAQQQQIEQLPNSVPSHLVDDNNLEHNMQEITYVILSKEEVLERV